MPFQKGLIYVVGLKVQGKQPKGENTGSYVSRSHHMHMTKRDTTKLGIQMLHIRIKVRRVSTPTRMQMSKHPYLV